MGILKRTLRGYNENNIPLYAGALSFYTIFALGPLFFLTLYVGSLFFDSVRLTVKSLIQTVFEGSAEQLLGFIEGFSFAPQGVFATILGTVFLLYAVIRLFTILQAALGRIWEEERSTGLRRYAVSLLLLVTAGSVVLGVVLLQIVSPNNLVISNLIGFFSVLAILTLIYKIMPKTDLSWRNAVLTASITALFFLIGETLIGFLFGNVTLFSVSNAIIAVLVLTYYNWQIILLGAQFSKEYIERGEELEVY